MFLQSKVHTDATDLYSKQCKHNRGPVQTETAPVLSVPQGQGPRKDIEDRRMWMEKLRN